MKPGPKSQGRPVRNSKPVMGAKAPITKPDTVYAHAWRFFLPKFYLPGNIKSKCPRSNV